MKIAVKNGAHTLLQDRLYSGYAPALFDTCYFILQTARPWQWTKNVLVFAGLFFAQQIFTWDKLTSAISAFFAFCCISSAVYIANDIIDRRKDALHPLKRYRPLASGALAVEPAVAAALVFAVTALWMAVHIDLIFFLILVMYLAMNIAYSLHFKNVVILDVIIIASGFMLRIIGGTMAVHEPASSWLIITATFLTLFLALGKRRSELENMGKGAAQTRKSLAEYTLSYINQLTSVVMTGSLMSYALYTLDAETIAKVGNSYLIFTLPFVIYGLFRYMFLIHTQNTEAPEMAIISDKPLLMCMGLYVVAVMVILYV